MQTIIAYQRLHISQQGWWNDEIQLTLALILQFLCIKLYLGGIHLA